MEKVLLIHHDDRYAAVFHDHLGGYNVTYVAHAAEAEPAFMDGVNVILEDSNDSLFSETFLKHFKKIYGFNGTHIRFRHKGDKYVGIRRVGTGDKVTEDKRFGKFKVLVERVLEDIEKLKAA